MFPTYFRYSAVTPDLPKPLNTAEAIAHLREHLYHEHHMHAYWRAKAKALEAKLAALEPSPDQRTTS